MKSITHEQLQKEITRGRGWVMLDRRSGPVPRVSKLHRANCIWVKEMKQPSVLFAEDGEKVTEWLDEHFTASGHRWKLCRECRRDRGSGLARKADGGEARDGGFDPDFTFRVGDHVLTDWDDNYATVVEGLPDAAIARFDGPWAPEVERRRIKSGGGGGEGRAINPERLRRQRIDEGVPGYLRVGDDWEHATICEHIKANRTMQVRHNGEEREVPEGEVRVRRTACVESPLAALASGYEGDVAAFRARDAFHAFYQPLARSARGLQAVLGSSVELHAHQLRVVRRVLSDPFQRYLLADEVGLGKTIEAGLIIRQRYLDAPRSVIHIACPESLVAQWSEELDTKIGIRSFRPNGKAIHAYDSEEGNTRPFSSHETPDLLIVDEAHRIAAGWESGDDAAESLYASAAELATRAPRVLLLSATPVLHHERTLLAMLHLLDPDTYRLNQADEFVQRMKDRERIAEIFALIDADAPSFVLRDAVSDLAEALPEDQRIAELGRESVGALEDSTGTDALEEAVLALRTHVGETYRVHSRVLRQRRRLVGNAGYTIRGRGGIVCIDPMCGSSAAIEAWLNELRGSLVDLAGDDPDQVEIADSFFQLFLERASGDPAALAALVRVVLTRRLPEYGRAGCDREDRAVVKAVWRSEALGPIKELVEKLEPILEADPDAEDGWLHAIWGALGEDDHPEIGVGSEKAVVFMSSGESATRAADHFIERAGPERVEQLTAEMDADDRSLAIRRFRDDPNCQFLFADRTAEEGLNLQVAGFVVMVDLPADTVRVEQRIGRADRYSTAAPVQCVGLSPVSGGLVDLWLGALRDGFGVFDESAAPIQFAVDQVERAFLRNLLLKGDSEATRDTGGLKARVEEEQERIDRIDSLDALASVPTREGELIEAYRTAESEMPDAVEVLDQLHGAYGPTLGIGMQVVDERTVSVEAVRENLITDRLEGVRTRRIRLAQDRSEVRLNSEDELIRPGVPAVETIRRMLDWLPEGQVFAAHASSSTYDSQVAYCCDLLVQADVGEVIAIWRDHEASIPHRLGAMRTAADAPLDAAGFHRWADAYFPPRLIRLWLNAGPEVIDDPALVQELERALEGAAVTDSLGEAGWKEAEVLSGVHSLDEVVESVAKVAEQAALHAASEERQPEDALARFKADMKVDLAQRELRAERVGSEEAVAELRVMKALMPKLAEAIVAPQATWHGAGVLLLSSKGARG